MNLLSACSYTLILLGLSSLFMAEIISPVLFIFVLVLVFCSPFRQSLGLVFGRGAINSVVLVITLWLLFNAFYFGADVLAQLLTFSLTLLVAILYSPKAYRDHLQILLICVFYLLAATLKIATLSFLIMLLAFVVVGIAYLILLNIRREELRCEPIHQLLQSSEKPTTVWHQDYGLSREIQKALGWSFFSRVLRIFVFIALISFAGFYAIPRFTWRMISATSPMVELQTGFSETVELGDIGEIITNHTPVMKVFVDGSIPASRVGLRWRGLTLDHFDGTSWSVSQAMQDRTEFVFPEGESPIRFRLEDQSPNTSQRFVLEPLNTRVLFVPPEPLQVTIIDNRARTTYLPANLFSSLRVQRLSGNLSTSSIDRYQHSAITKSNRLRQRGIDRPMPLALKEILSNRESGLGSPLTYQVQSRSPVVDSSQLKQDNQRDYPPEIKNFYLQLPQELERIGRLARAVTDEGDSPFEQAVAVELYLRRNYQYSLTPESGREKMSLEDFLFQVRKGHCEYFSSAMAIMLRSLDIPCRVANGFVAGEFNPFGKFFQVRQSDAHSWVEVFFPQHGWIAFDPTPPQSNDGFKPFQTLGHLLEVFRTGWINYFVDYGFAEQRQLFGRMYSMLAPRNYWDFFRFDDQEPVRKKSSLMPKILLAIGVLGILLWGRVRGVWKPSLADTRSNPRQHPDIRSAIAFYEQMLKILARRGIQREPGQTAAELAEQVNRQLMSAGPMVNSITEIYHSVRFGQGTFTPEMQNKVKTMLRNLKQLN